MVQDLRRRFNQQFSNEKYEAYIHELKNVYPGHLHFRIAETPVFVPEAFTRQMFEVCETVIDLIQQPLYLEQSERAIPANFRVQNEASFPHFIAFDFGICLNEKGGLEPQLIEMQGFPTLFAWHVIVPEIAKKHFELPDNYDFFLNGFNKQTYFDLLKRILIADCQPEQVVLLEIQPHQQKTRVDFYATEDILGIKPLCITDIIKEGKDLFYINNGKKTPIKRIYNRVVFDELLQQPAHIQEKARFFQEDLNVTWLPHPNWFYRLSKFTLPFIKHPLVPQTRFLSEVNPIPEDLENYVVKPLFSFAGQGVIIDVTKQDIENIKDPQNWILQKKVTYAPVIETPEEPAKAEIRLFYFWEPGAPRPMATNNLARLSKGKMIGVNFNKDKTWVGGSFCLFEK